MHTLQNKRPKILHTMTWLAPGGEDFAWRSVDENMAMGLCYTSGTTGQPKGVVRDNGGHMVALKWSSLNHKSPLMPGVLPKVSRAV